ARLGGDVDVANARPGRGAELSSTVVLHASDHLALEGMADFTWLDVQAGGVARRLFTAGIARLRATYNVTPRTAFRLVVQNERTRRDPALYLAPAAAVEGGLMVSALLTYRWGWASALYLGLEDDRPGRRLLPCQDRLRSRRATMERVRHPQGRRPGQGTRDQPGVAGRIRRGGGRRPDEHGGDRQARDACDRRAVPAVRLRYRCGSA